jgi:hypothetical protein
VQKNYWILWHSFPSGLKRYTFEALVFLLVAKLCIKVFPFKRLAPLLGEKNKTLVQKPISKKKLEKMRLVRQSIALTARNVPWKSLCLDQATAGKWMLNRRGIASTLHFGVLTEKQNNTASKTLKAHAWLWVHPNYFVTGFTTSLFKEIAFFA